jgi:hypothetical protein
LSGQGENADELVLLLSYSKGFMGWNSVGYGNVIVLDWLLVLFASILPLWSVVRVTRMQQELHDVRKFDCRPSKSGNFAIFPTAEILRFMYRVQ